MLLGRARSSSSRTIPTSRCLATQSAYSCSSPTVSTDVFARAEQWTSAGKKSNQFSREVVRHSSSVRSAMGTDQPSPAQAFVAAFADADWERVTKAVAEAGVWLS